jgi:hypothetical protein
VSVFELDSDSETEADAAADEGGNSFAKRIARGLHKKSASEKRGGGGAAAAAEHKAVAAGLAALDGEGSERDADEKARDSDSLGRKRGGSLGRIFGLMGR